MLSTAPNEYLCEPGLLVLLSVQLLPFKTLLLQPTEESDLAGGWWEATAGEWEEIYTKSVQVMHELTPR